jgi:L-amino acid N-acyltransferase YncA
MTATGASITVRAAADADAAAIAAIYNQGVAERAATFDTDTCSPDEVRGWLLVDGEPLLVAERDGEVIGFARVIASKERCALAGVGEYTIYLERDARGHGVGRRLLDALVGAADAAGFWKLQGRMFTTNTASVALARRCGFREVGVYERHGRLDGHWIDLVIVERLLSAAA